MGVRNCEELGTNLQKIMSRLLSNQRLLKLLYYTDKDPYSQPDLTQEQIQKEVFEKFVKIVPRVGPKETANSIIVLKVGQSEYDESNSEFRNIRIDIESFVPLTQWIIKDDNLRPFAIMGEVQKTLNGKTINGLGKIKGGDFILNFLTEEISAYTQEFSITTYD